MSIYIYIYIGAYIYIYSVSCSSWMLVMMIWVELYTAYSEGLVYGGHPRRCPLRINVTKIWKRKMHERVLWSIYITETLDGGRFKTYKLPLMGAFAPQTPERTLLDMLSKKSSKKDWLLLGILCFGIVNLKVTKVSCISLLYLVCHKLNYGEQIFSKHVLDHATACLSSL